MSDIFTKEATDRSSRLSKFDVKKGRDRSGGNHRSRTSTLVNDRIQAWCPGQDSSSNSMVVFRCYIQHDKNEIIGEWKQFEIKGDLVIGKGRNLSLKSSRGSLTPSL